MGRLQRLQEGIKRWKIIKADLLGKYATMTNNEKIDTAIEFADEMIKHLNAWYALERDYANYIRDQKLFYATHAHFIWTKDILPTARRLDERKVALLREGQRLLKISQAIDVPSLKDNVPVTPIKRGPDDDPAVVKTIEESQKYWEQHLVEIDEGIAYLQEVLDASRVTDAAAAYTRQQIFSLHAERYYYDHYVKDELEKDKLYQTSNGTSETLAELYARKKDAREAQLKLLRDGYSLEESIEIGKDR